MPVDVRGFFDKILKTLPSPGDFVPTRFVRKISMVVGYCGIIMFALSIAAVSYPTWLVVNSTETVVGEHGISVNLTTTGDCSLRKCDLCESSPGTIVVDCFSGDPEELTGVEQLTSFGVGIVWIHVVQILLIPVLMAFAFIHGWSRFDSQILSYFLAAGLCLAEWLLGTVSYALYLGAKPTDADETGGYSLGTGFILCMVNSFLFLAMLVAVIIDKPEGLFEYRPKLGSKSSSDSSSTLSAPLVED